MGLVDGNPIFTIDFDFVAHQLLVCSITGQVVSFPLAGQSVASFYRHTLDALHALGVEVSIEHPHPFDLPDAGRPFAEDTEHAAYDPLWATRYWQVLSQVNLVLEEFAARFSGKIGPVHHFWHTLDIAVSRFSDRRIDEPKEVDPVTREAYSREVISSGFWFGDDNFPQPAFYSYTAPEPAGLAEQPLQPQLARWVQQRGSHLAVLAYDEVRAQTDPKASVLDFYEKRLPGRRPPRRLGHRPPGQPRWTHRPRHLSRTTAALLLTASIGPLGPRLAFSQTWRARQGSDLRPFACKTRRRC